MMKSTWKEAKMKVAASSKIGTYHLAQGLPCQDYVKGISSNSLGVIALADGAGSYEHSELASKIVVESIVDSFYGSFDSWYELEDDIFKMQLVELCFNAMEQSAKNLMPTTTLLLYAANADGRYILVHIGDGYIFGIDYGGTASVLSMPENGNEPNQTFFLSDAKANDHIRIKKAIDFDYKGVLLASDGAASALIDKVNDKYAPALRKIIDMLEGEPELVVSKTIEKALDGLFRLRTVDDMSIGALLKSIDQ